MQDVGDLKKEQDPDRAKVKQSFMTQFVKTRHMAHTENDLQHKGLSIKRSS